MFKIIVTTKNYRTGRITTETFRNKYKTYQGAEKAARGMRRVCMPDSKTITETVDADVVEVKRT
ncbi:hypothetical protein [Photorhabdus luminescens]|uniref:Uncharacterized protein n=1 Tax=Photorhabdus luminescens subsp. mexicana TaxID=2100167 RepID=A0A4R4J3G0_PHOLU|nr:hypothetical protein [Photorhabdus luminescens]TDB48053.1 hypothetical protein C5468_16750 [Photorhabdus luminescens subsp. mexicana]